MNKHLTTRGARLAAGLAAVALTATDATCFSNLSFLPALLLPALTGFGGVDSGGCCRDFCMRLV